MKLSMATDTTDPMMSMAAFSKTRRLRLLLRSLTSEALWPPDAKQQTP